MDSLLYPSPILEHVAPGAIGMELVQELSKNATVIKRANEILFHILKYLPLPDLLATSAVCRRLNVLSRKIIHDQRRCCVYLKLSKSCEDRLKEFLDVIHVNFPTLAPPPYNCLHLDLKHLIFHPTNRENCQENLCECLRRVECWERLEIRHISVYDPDYHHPSCRLLSSLNILFASPHFSSHIRSLHANVLCFDQIFKSNRHKKLYFQHIQSLNVDLINESSKNQDMCRAIYQTLKKTGGGRPPSLTEFVGPVSQHQLVLFDESSSFLVKNCQFTPKLTTKDLERIFAFFMEPVINLKKLAILGCDSPQTNQNLFEHIIELILANSQYTLQELRTNLPVLNFVAKIGAFGPPFGSVDRLDIVVGFDSVESFSEIVHNFEDLLTAFPFSKLFPRLRNVTIVDDPSISKNTNFVPDSFSRLNEKNIFKVACVTVSQITIESPSPSSSALTIQYLAQVFPNVRDFTYSKTVRGTSPSESKDNSNDDDDDLPNSRTREDNDMTSIFTMLFKYTQAVWKGLEVVRFKAQSQFLKQLEPCLMGVDPEEVSNWHNGVCGYINIRKLQFPPFRVSVFNRTKLKFLYIGVYDDYPGFRFRYAEPCLLTRVPHLKLTIRTENERPLH